MFLKQNTFHFYVFFSFFLFSVDGEGIICGIDLSEMVCDQAMKNFKWEIRQGRVDITHGDVMLLPFR